MEALAGAGELDVCMELTLYKGCVAHLCRVLKECSATFLSAWLPVKGINRSSRRGLYLGYIERLQEACAMAGRGYLDRCFEDVWFPVVLPFVESFEDRRDILVAAYTREIDRLLALGVDGYRCYMPSSLLED